MAENLAYQPGFRSADGLLTTEHLGGVAWNDAPLPKRWHRCWPQTRGWIGLDQVERCACGASRRNGHVWVDKNQTRKRARRG